MAKKLPNEAKQPKETKQPKGLKELWRKFLVSIKRRPQLIPLVALLAAFLVYSLNLTQISNTTALIQGPNMGLAGFATMLFSMLSLLVFLNTFPYRKKTNVTMLVILFVMLAIIAFSDVYYLNAITAAVTKAENAIKITQATSYIAYAQYYLQVHLIILAVAVVLIVLLPVYRKLLRKIKTSIDVSDNGEMGAIDISGED